MTASKWYNFHLLFDAIYDGVNGPQLNFYRLKFSLFTWAQVVQKGGLEGQDAFS